jgi:hypothetical protein
MSYKKCLSKLIAENPDRWELAVVDPGRRLWFIARMPSGFWVSFYVHGRANREMRRRIIPSPHFQEAYRRVTDSNNTSRAAIINAMVRDADNRILSEYVEIINRFGTNGKKWLTERAS